MSDKKKQDLQAYALITGLWLVIGLVVGCIVSSLSNKEKTYEYALNCEIGRSKECYLDDSVGYCIVDGEKIRVDNYYEVEE